MSIFNGTPIVFPQATVRDGMGAIESQQPRSRTPSTASITPDISASFTAIVQIAKDILINPDVAYRADRTLQDQMLHDPVVMGPLQKRWLAVAQLPWEVVGDDEHNEQQRAICGELKEIIANIPRFQEFLRGLSMANFRGTAAAEMFWAYDGDNRWCINNHRPYHGDKITYDRWGQPRILTQRNQVGGRQLDNNEKDRMVIHTFDREDGEFYDGAQAGYVFKGRGLRDIIWPFWFLKINSIRFWVTLLERYGTGWVEGRYPMGNKTAKNAIESVLQNLVNDSKYSLPMLAGGMEGGENEGNYGIKVHKMEGLGESAKLFSDFAEGYLGKHIRIIIEGQEQEHQTTGDGLGSGRAGELAETFQAYRDYDAGLLADSLTEQLVAKLVYFNYGRLDFKPKFKFLLEKRSYEESSKRIDSVIKAKLRVTREWLHDTLDVPQPTGLEQPDEIIDFGAGALPGEDPHDPLNMQLPPDHQLFGGTEPAKLHQLFGNVLNGGGEHTLFDGAKNGKNPETSP